MSLFYLKNFKWGTHSFFCKILIIRGIGYRAFIILNDSSINVLKNELIFSRYIVIRAGHTADLYYGVPRGIIVKTSKKDRKLVIFGPDLNLVSLITKFIVDYRAPSIYTGRGVRRKYLKLKLKAGKKDKQKGKSY